MLGSSLYGWILNPNSRANLSIGLLSRKMNPSMLLMPTSDAMLNKILGNSVASLEWLKQCHHRVPRNIRNLEVSSC